MVDGHYGTVVDGVFVCSTGHSFNGFGSSGPVSLSSLPRGAVVTIHVAGKSRFFSIAIASTNTLNPDVYYYNNNHHVAFHYSSAWGRVNSDWVLLAYEKRLQRRHYVSGGGAAFTASLTLRGADHSVSFSVNGVPQNGAWPLPTTDVFYLMLATNGGGTIAVTDVSVTMADLA